MSFAQSFIQVFKSLNVNSSQHVLINDLENCILKCFQKNLDTFIGLLNRSHVNKVNSEEFINVIHEFENIWNEERLHSENQKNCNDNKIRSFSPVFNVEINAENSSLLRENRALGDRTWKCGCCDIENDDTVNKCQGCETDKVDPDSSEVVTKSRNEIRLLLPTANDFNQRSILVDRRSLGDPRSSDSVRNTCQSGDCANQFKMKDKEILKPTVMNIDKNKDTPQLDTGPNDKWECGKCTKMNSFDYDKCSNCGCYGPHYDKWRCEHCSAINGKLNTNCDTCFQLNPFIERCSRCHRNDINSKYSKVCDYCNTVEVNKQTIDIDRRMAPIDRTTNISNTPRQDGWSCSKCSLHSLFDLVKCAACGTIGPHINKWRCDLCTCLNDSWKSICSACNEYQHIRNIFTISPALLTNEGNDRVEMVDSKYDMVQRKLPCVNCSAALSDKDDRFCHKCKDKYYICENTNCNTICNKEIRFCTNCGIKQYSNPSNGGIVECCIDDLIRKVWQCSFKKCAHLNFENIYRCIMCQCPKMITAYFKCNKCGWIKYYDVKCDQCDDD